MAEVGNPFPARREDAGVRHLDVVHDKGHKAQHQVTVIAGRICSPAGDAARESVSVSRSKHSR